MMNNKLNKDLFDQNIFVSKKVRYFNISFVVSIILFLLYFVFATKIATNLSIKDSIFSISDFMIINFEGVKQFSQNGEFLYQNGVFIGYICGVVTLVSLITFFMFVLLFSSEYRAIKFSNKKSIYSISSRIFFGTLFFIGFYYVVMFVGAEGGGELLSVDRPKYTYIGSTIIVLSANIGVLMVCVMLLQYFFALKNHIKSPSSHKYIPKPNDHHDNCPCDECQNTKQKN